MVRDSLELKGNVCALSLIVTEYSAKESGARGFILGEVSTIIQGRHDPCVDCHLELSLFPTEGKMCLVVVRFLFFFFPPKIMFSTLILMFDELFSCEVSMACQKGAICLIYDVLRYWYPDC